MTYSRIPFFLNRLRVVRVAKGRIFAFSIDLLCRFYNGLPLPCGNTGLSHNMALDSYIMMSKLQTALLSLEKPVDRAAAVVVEFRLNGVVIAVYKYLTFIPVYMYS